MIEDWKLERYKLGELDPAEMVEVRELVAREESVQARLLALETSDTELLSERPPVHVASAIRARAASAQHPRMRWLRPALVAALGLVALIGLVVPPAHPPDSIRLKGLAPRLLLYRQSSGSGVEPLAPGSVAGRDDVVQIAYVAAGRRYGTIVSIDGRGVVTRHLPAMGSSAPALQPGGPHALAEAYRLDDAPGFERFYLVLADEPFAVDTVAAAVAATRRGSDAGTRLALPESFEQVSFELRKQALR